MCEGETEKMAKKEALKVKVLKVIANMAERRIRKTYCAEILHQPKRPVKK